MTTRKPYVELTNHETVKHERPFYGATTTLELEAWSGGLVDEATGEKTRYVHADSEFAAWMHLIGCPAYSRTIFWEVVKDVDEDETFVASATMPSALAAEAMRDLVVNVCGSILKTRGNVVFADRLRDYSDTVRELIDMDFNAA